MARPKIPSGDDGPAHYLAWVAFPREQADRGDRDQFVRAALRIQAKAADIPRRELPDVLRNSEGRESRIVSQFNRGVGYIFRRRRPAAYAALTLLDANGPDTIADALEVWSGKCDIEPSQLSDPRNARERVWRPSQPALAMTLSMLYSSASLRTLAHRSVGEDENREAAAKIVPDGPIPPALAPAPDQDSHPNVPAYSLLTDTHWLEDAIAGTAWAAPLVANLVADGSPVYVPRLAR